MTTTTAAIFIISGTLLNMIGIACAVRALLLDWSTYGHGPLWPWAAKQKTKVNNFARRMMLWSKREAQIRATSVSASINVGASVSVTLRKRLDFKEETPDAEKIRNLADAVKYIYDELDENRKEVKSKHESLAALLNELSKRMDSKGDHLEKQMKEIATGDVRPQLISITLIGTGTLTAAIPTICALFY